MMYRLMIATRLLTYFLCVMAASLAAQQASPEQNSAVLRRQREIQAAHVPGSKTVRLERYTPDDPVRVVGIMEDGRDISATPPFRPTDGKPFLPNDSENWIKDIKVVIKNVSNKKIVGGSILLLFPETITAEHPGVAQSITLGQRPEHYSPIARHTVKGSSDTPPLSLLPGEELTVSVEPYYASLKGALAAKGPVSTISSCMVKLSFFYFADGTRWAPNNFQKLGSDGKYTNISVDEFRSTTSAD